MNSSWKAFLERKHDVFRSTPIRLCDWVETLLHFGILPELRLQGYNITVNQQSLATCILNYLYRHVKDYPAHRFTTYRCSHAACHNSYYEEEEHYSEQLPDSTWTALRTAFPVDTFADSSWFADRIWNALPNIIFAHTCLDTSPANIALWEQLNPEEDEEATSDSR